MTTNNLVGTPTGGKARSWTVAVTAGLCLLIVIRPVLFLLAACLLALLAGRYIQRAFPLSADPSSAPDRASLLLCWWPWVVVLSVAVWMATTAPLPHDDLLRHVNARAWGYDYASHYGHHIVDQHWSYWFGFDWFVGHVHAVTGDVLTTTRWVRSLLALLVGAFAVLAVRRLHADPVIQSLAVSLILFELLWFRLLLGRPEALFAGLLLAALALPRLAWMALFCLLAPTYWLAGLYAAGALLLGRPAEPVLRRAVLNVSTLAACLMAWVGWWWWYGDGELLHFTTLLTQVVQTHGQQEAPVGELMPVVYGISSPLVVVLLIALLCRSWALGACALFQDDPWSRTRATVVACFAVAALFAIPDYARYGPVIWTMVACALLAMSERLRVPGAWYVASLIVLVAVLAIGLSSHSGNRASETILQSLEVPDKRAILTTFNEANFLAAAANPGNVITPIFDIASTVQPYRRLVTELSLGRLDCQELLGLGPFGWVIENTLSGQVPECLQLHAVDGDYRVWEVRR